VTINVRPQMSPIDKAVYLPQQYGGTWKNLWMTSMYQRVQNHLNGCC